MPLVNWTDKLSLGITEIDNQHKKWIAIINDLNDAMRAGKSTEVLGEVFKRLIDYTEYHFKAEETYFEKFGYPEKTSHKWNTRKWLMKLTVIITILKQVK